MVNITRRIDGQTQISNEKNSVQICRKCIDDIIACLTNNKITVEASFAILDECKNENSLLNLPILSVLKIICVSYLFRSYEFI